MNFCPNCGAQCAEGACPNGCEVNLITPPAVQSYQQPTEPVPPPVYPQQNQGYPPPQKKKMGGCLIAFITTAITLTGMVIVIMLFTWLSGGLAIARSDSSEREPVQSSSESAKESSSPVSIEAKDETPKHLTVGESSRIGDWEVTLTSFEVLKKVDSSFGYFTPDEGNRYVVAYFTVKNAGEDSGTFLSQYSIYGRLRAKILYQNDYEFTSTNLLGHDNDLHNKSLNPLTSISGIIAFDIVQEVAESGELVLELSQGNEKIAYLLK